MKIFLKGFCIGLLCLSLLGLLWFLVLQPGLTNGEAQALKKEYAQPLPGAESSGVLPAGKEQSPYSRKLFLGSHQKNKFSTEQAKG